MPLMCNLTLALQDKLNLIAAIVQAGLNGILLYQTVETARGLRSRDTNGKTA